MVKPIADIRRPAIVQAAIRTIGKHGLPTPSYDLIAQEAEMSRQLVRHYFPNPEELMVSVCDGLAAAYEEALAEGILNADKSGRLSLFLDFYFNFLAGENLAKPMDDGVYDAMMSLATGSEKVRQSLHNHYAQLQSTIAQEVRVNDPSLSRSACHEIGYLFVTLIYGHWKMVASLGFSENNNRVAREAVDRLIASYQMEIGVREKWAV
ncbi:hypothetical protein P775_19330 [Puniceibacterium antarcticum]|uniref:HTH tetR-type domain-containing protein n=2 Tax=Puniceibacterium antarcticum TaxID=1206336 RepID=A0A2G8RAZ0_9RHOB|nr:hypothetical protein P775_19330 [Puniceibacterium antarcticum]